MITGPGVCEEASGGLEQLEFMGVGGDASEEGVTVVKAGGDEGVDEGFTICDYELS